MKHLFMLIETNPDEVEEISPENVGSNRRYGESKLDRKFADVWDIDLYWMHISIDGRIVNGSVSAWPSCDSLQAQCGSEVAAEKRIFSTRIEKSFCIELDAAVP